MTWADGQYQRIEHHLPKPRPDKKNLKAFYDYIHRRRCFLFQQWRSWKTNEVSDEQMGQSVDHLTGLVLLLEHCQHEAPFPNRLRAIMVQASGK